MPAPITLEISNDDILAAIGAAGLDKFERDSATLYALWAEEGERVAVEAFRGEVSPDGKAWAPLSPSTLSRRSRTPRVGILRVTRNLIDSVVGQTTEDGAEIGSNLRVGGGRYNLLAIHQNGATIKRAASRRTIEFKVNMKTGQSRFARRGKGNFAQDVSVGAYEIIIPARPVLPLDSNGNILPSFANEIEAITADWLGL
jgi:hypothetical protein